ncbi:MAG: hypothetical protein UR98_C0018G0010 [Parcubacteria group bacterium GW2011_GWA1_36_12]|nr:MAG: hypothetical protein UR98_C0018G0010 [Parcubacteria group bacterium GW2011_GWA1_36_12]
MFEDYHASKDDLRVLEQALNSATHPKMGFVFSNFSRIAGTLIISYDSKYIYIWQLNPIRLASKILHNLTIPDEWQRGWWASIISKNIEKYLPKNNQGPVINGGLLTPFVSLQKTKNVLLNPYTTKESYFATIIHEFGHIYWNSYKLWWPSNKEKNINLMKDAKSLYLSKANDKKFNIRFPSPIYASEVFAHCTEYYASELFWPKHKKNFDKFAVSQINIMIATEKNKNLDIEDSVFEPTKNQHNYSLVVGKLLTNTHSKDWPKLLTNS